MSSGRCQPVDCRAAIDNLYAYLDGELSAELQESIRQHLEECSQCFPEFELERLFLRFLEARAQAQRAPSTLRRRIFETTLLKPDDRNPAGG